MLKNKVIKYKKLYQLSLIFLLLFLPLLLLALIRETSIRSNAFSSSLETENGSLSGNASVQTDPLASGGKYVEFGKTALNQPNYLKIADAQNGGFAYAYAPSIIQKDGKYHVFFCSQGGWTNNEYTWDYIRYVSSPDGKNWSQPSIILRARFNGFSDKAACDPSVVFFQGYYYMYYSSAYLFQKSPEVWLTNIQVARSNSLTGPYLTYTNRGTWESLPNDPKIIIKPKVEKPVNCCYGAGQQTVVVRNNTLLMWYTDDTYGSPNTPVRFLSSTNPVIWDTSKTQSTNLQTRSMDLKYSAQRNEFVAAQIDNQHAPKSQLALYSSQDGIAWKQLKILIPSDIFPYFANNVGLAGDENGNLTSGEILIGFGAPYDLNAKNDNWGKWNLYGILIPPL